MVANSGYPLDHYMGLQADAVPKDSGGPDDTEWTNLNMLAQLGLRINKRQRVNSCHLRVSTSIAANSA